jgi:hypothetical protein
MRRRPHGFFRSPEHVTVPIPARRTHGWRDGRRDAGQPGSRLALHVQGLTRITPPLEKHRLARFHSRSIVLPRVMFYGITTPPKDTMDRLSKTRFSAKRLVLCCLRSSSLFIPALGIFYGHPTFRPEMNDHYLCQYLIPYSWDEHTRA